MTVRPPRELGWRREGDMEIGAIGEQTVHVCNPFVDLNFGAYRAETAFAGSGNMAYFSRMVGTGIGGVTKAFRFPTVHDFPDVVGHVDGDQMSEGIEKGFPIILENLLERKAISANGLHGGREFTS